jgi:FkbM family methyltransferase
MNLPLLARLAVPYARLELPGWGRVLGMAGVLSDDERWRGAPTVTVRGKFHGYLMSLDLSNWSERRTYFLGRFYELATQLFVRQFVRLGDSFVDVGGNIGMITLLAAHGVGASGRVHAFEPNPVAFGRLKRALEVNRIAHVTARQVALGDRPGEMVLSVLLGHTGMGTLGELNAADQGKVTDRHKVEVVRGDDVLPPHLPGPMTIKIDVEGFECHALRGLSRTLDRLRPAVIAEALPVTLARAGESVPALLALMEGHGYRAYDLDIEPDGLRYGMKLTTLTGADALGGSNVAFIHPDSEHAHRLGAWRQANGA